jgi:hypothetical protein
MLPAECSASDLSTLRMRNSDWSCKLLKPNYQRKSLNTGEDTTARGGKLHVPESQAPTPPPPYPGGPTFCLLTTKILTVNIISFADIWP